VGSNPTVTATRKAPNLPESRGSRGLRHVAGEPSAHCLPTLDAERASTAASSTPSARWTARSARRTRTGTKTTRRQVESLAVGGRGDDVHMGNFFHTRAQAVGALASAVESLGIRPADLDWDELEAAAVSPDDRASLTGWTFDPPEPERLRVVAERYRR